MREKKQNVLNTTQYLKLIPVNETRRLHYLVTQQEEEAESKSQSEE